MNFDIVISPVFAAAAGRPAGDITLAVLRPMTPDDARRSSALLHREPIFPQACPPSRFTVRHAVDCARLCVWYCLKRSPEERAADVGTVNRATAAPLGPGTDWPVRDHREARRGRDGAGVPRPFHDPAAGRGA